jgi:hypothetical protein
MHAAIQFQYDYPEWAKSWFDNSEYLALLAVNNEKELQDLAFVFKCKDIDYSAFFEPDINNQMTAITVEPSIRAKKICSQLPLALKEFSYVENNV